MKTTIPKDAKRIPLRPLALGEVSGHHHSFLMEDETALEDAVEMYEKGGQTFVRIKTDGVILGHQEHAPVAVPPGDYTVRIQTEVTDWGSAAVID